MDISNTDVVPVSIARRFGQLTGRESEACRWHYESKFQFRENSERNKKAIKLKFIN